MNAQLVREDTISLSGVVLDSDSLFSLPNVHIKNQKNKGTLSDANGQFAFKASQLDKQTVSATRNLSMAAFTARTYTPGVSSFDMVDYQLNQYAQATEYKGMVAPNQSFNIIGFASYLIFLSHQQLTKDEKEYRLRQELRQYIYSKDSINAKP